MRRDATAAAALIAGAIMGMVTMLLHPTGHRMAADFVHQAPLAVGVHALALAGVPILFFGALGLARRLGGGDLAIMALVVYAFASVAVSIAATASGFLATDLMRRMATSGGVERVVLHELLDYTGSWNHAFARVFVVASSVAMVLWSIAILRSRALARWAGVLGVIVGVLTLLVSGFGHLRLDVHGFGAVVLAQAAWLISVGALMMRPAPAARAA